MLTLTNYGHSSWLIMDLKPRIDTPKADYACRVFIPKELMEKLMAKAVMDIDYANFKGTIPSKDRLRHDAYFQCWEAMWGWQARLRMVGKGQSKAM